MLERDVSKAFILVIGAAVVADILTHGDVAVKLGGIIAGLVNNAFAVSAGQTVKH